VQTLNDDTVTEALSALPETITHKVSEPIAVPPEVNNIPITQAVTDLPTINTKPTFLINKP
jgi:hypothetical protein